MKKVLFLASFLIGSLFGADETSYTKGVNNTSNCAVECPPMKEGFFGRIANFNYDTGETLCYVYSKQEPTKALAKVTNTNKKCVEDLINPNATPTINSNTSGVNSHLQSQDIASNNFGDGKINLAKYMVAGLMADDNVIDLPTSISSNKVTLKPEYSLITSSSSAKEKNEDMVSKTQLALSNSVTFVMNFLAKSSKILMSFQVALFLFVVALSLIFMFTQKGTKKVSGVGDHDDYAEKIVLGVFSILLFFLPMNKITTVSGDIPQNGYQQLIRPLLYLGVETADKLSQTATSSVLAYKFSEVGVNVTEDMRKLKNNLYVVTEKRKYFESMSDLCSKVYNTSEMKGVLQTIGSNSNYPPSEDIFIKGFGNEEKRAITFYTDKMMNQGYLTQNRVPTASYCYHVENSLIAYLKEESSLTKKINEYNNAVSSSMDRKINTLTDLTYANVNELGFVSIVNLGTTLMAFDNFKLMGEATRESDTHEITMKDYRNQTGYEVQGFAQQDDEGWIDGAINVAINDVLTDAPYYIFLPFADNIQEQINKRFNPIVDRLEASAKGVGAIFKAVPVVGDALATGAELLVGKGSRLAVGVATNMITMFILTTVIAILPLLAIIGAGILVMSFYFLSILILYVTIPFASIFAFSTGNLDIIKNLIKHTFLLSVRPILIVVSVLISVFVFQMIDNFNQVLITSMFEPMFAITNNIEAVRDGVPMYNVVDRVGVGGIFLFIKSTFLLVASLLTTFICFYLVFNGANIILDILGMRDGGFDVGGIIGDKVEGKSAVSNNMTFK